MALALGTRLGPYEVTAVLGAGGMGEVYRATDTDLKRTVAIKVLPDSMAADAQRLMRFQREAEALATLNHPHIAQIYGVVLSGDTRALVMEFVEGRTLADRLARSPMRLDEVLSAARQIAEGVEAAHEQGIVHRDLKPANVIIRTDGTVKVLDFGLAKMSANAAEPVSVDPGAATVTAAGSAVRDGRTEVGVILGTVAYMSPEQARGDHVDRRTDNWAFGCILLEMLTGRQAFTGATVADLVASILRGEPDWSRLPADTPLPLRHLIERCLQNDRRKRLQFIGDARVDIERLIDHPTVDGVVRPSQRPSRLATWSLAGLVVALAATSIVAFRSLRADVPAPREIRFEIPYESNVPTLKISPDGKQIAYASPSPAGKGNVIWIRPLDSVTPHMLPGTEGAGLFGWSWDSRSIVFREGGGNISASALKKVEVSGGSAQVIATNAGGGAFPVWGREDVILFSASGSGALRKVSAAGGDAADVTTLDASKSETLHMWPSFLPDGRHFTYLAWRTGSGSDTGTLYVASIDPKEPRVRLMDASSMAIYARPGYLLYVANKSLMARPFDASHLRFSGDAFAVADNVQVTATGRLVADVSDDGSLVYRSMGAVVGAPFQWIDRSGSVLSTTCPISLPGPKTAWRLSPDDKRVAVFAIADVDIWLCDLARQQPLRLTNDPPWDRYPVWSQPDGSAIVFGSFRSSGNTANALFEKAATGTTAERLVVPEEPGTVMVPLDWSRDGKWILFSKEQSQRRGATTQGNRDLWMVPRTGDRTARPYLASEFDESQAAFSPDGRFVAYVSNQNGRLGEYDVVVQPFPNPSAGKWKISSNGGCCPRWNRDGSELYYVNATHQLVAVSVRTTPAFASSRQTTLGITLPGDIDGYEYDVAADGQRFLVAGRSAPDESGGRGRPMTVVLNWAARFRR